MALVCRRCAKVWEEGTIRFENRFKEIGFRFSQKKLRKFLKRKETGNQTYPQYFCLLKCFTKDPLKNGVFRTNRKWCIEITAKISKLNRIEADRNLKLAAQNTQRQRSVHLRKNLITYQEQILKVSHCPYCGSSLGPFNGVQCAQLDHIYPVSSGGLSTVHNLVYVCSSCNLKKRDATLNMFIISNGLDREKVYENLDQLEKAY